MASLTHRFEPIDAEELCKKAADLDARIALQTMADRERRERMFAPMDQMTKDRKDRLMR